MITKEQLMKLSIGHELHHCHTVNADGSPERWRINGKVKTWKTRPNEFEVPIKHGIKEFSYLTEDDAAFYCATVDEVYLIRAVKHLQTLKYYDRKPCKWSEIRSGVFGEEKHLQYLPRLTCWDLYNEKTDPVPYTHFANDPGRVFIYVCTNENEYLVNTEHYDYVRYALRIK